MIEASSHSQSLFNTATWSHVECQHASIPCSIRSQGSSSVWIMEIIPLRPFRPLFNYNRFSKGHKFIIYCREGSIWVGLVLGYDNDDLMIRLILYSYFLLLVRGTSIMQQKQSKRNPNDQ